MSMVTVDSSLALDSLRTAVQALSAQVGTKPIFDIGSTGFMLLCCSLVMLMTPGLAFFYGGLVGKKNVLTIMMQSFVSLCLTTVIWYIVGYSLCFSGSMAQGNDFMGILGNLDKAFLKGVGFRVLWDELAVLFVMGVVMIFLSAKRFRKTI